MKALAIILLLFFTILFYSCSTIRLTNRNQKDLLLNATNFEKLKGNYSNLTSDTNHFNRTLFNNFQIDTSYTQKQFIVNIFPTSPSELNIKLYKKDSLIQSLAVRGKLKHGYFRVRREYRAKFIAGPLLWVLGENLMCIGLSKENNLVVINSGSSGYLLLIAVPIFVAGGGQFENEYKRNE